MYPLPALFLPVSKLRHADQTAEKAVLDMVKVLGWPASVLCIGIYHQITGPGPEGDVIRRV